MKKLILLNGLVFILLVSGCIQFEGTITSFDNPQFIGEQKDLELQAEFYPEEIKTGKDLNLNFLINAKKNIEDITFNLYDTCLFTTAEKQKIKVIRANTSKVIRLKLTAGETEFERDCNIKFKLDYSANTSASQDVIVLSDVEYTERQRTNRLNEFTPQLTKIASPLDISISFSEEQPFQEETEILMNIDYYNIGTGFIDKIEKNNIQIIFPDNLELKECNDYTNGLLNKDLIFIKNKAKTSTCRFITKALQPIDAKNLLITGKYKYVIDNYITVKIKPK